MSAHTTTPRNTSEQTRHVVGSPVARHAFALTRLSIGWIFLWAFLDKLLGLGFSTPAEGAWINGGSPTTGYLSSLDGLFSGLFDPMIGAVWADILFMVGLGAIGAALMLGIGQRVATVTGVLLLMLMYVAALPLPSNPFMTDYIVMSLALIGLLYADSAQTLGLGHWWSSTSLVQRFPILK